MLANSSVAQQRCAILCGTSTHVKRGPRHALALGWLGQEFLCTCLSERHNSGRHGQKEGDRGVGSMPGSRDRGSFRTVSNYDGT